MPKWKMSTFKASQPCLKCIVNARDAVTACFSSGEWRWLPSILNSAGNIMFNLPQRKVTLHCVHLHPLPGVSGDDKRLGNSKKPNRLFSTSV